ncbi:MAG TPA: hypothetical protein PLL69_06880 [Gemmatimonadales bacterium]|nr:hypothetical protein [Gemmatimonadales bacterium]
MLCGDCAIAIDSIAALQPDEGGEPLSARPVIAISRADPVRILASSLDRDRVLAFDMSGTHVGSLGHPGEGPGELAQIEAITSGSDGNAVVTRMDGRVVTFDSAGALVGESRTRLGCVALIEPAGSICAGRWSELDDPDQRAFHLLSPDGNALRSFGPAVSKPCLMCQARIGRYGAADFGEFWAMSRSGAIIQLWDTGGRLLSSVAGESVLDSLTAELVGDVPAIRKVVGAALLSGDSLLLAMIAVDTSTEELGGQPILAAVDGQAVNNPALARSDESRVAGSLAVIVDPRHGVVATGTSPKLLRVADQDYIYSIAENATGEIVVVVWKVRLVRSALGGGSID